MKTGDLISMLARDAGPAPRAVAARRLWPVAGGGALAAAGTAVALLGLVPAPLFATIVPWMKIAYGLALAAAAGWLAARLGRPLPRLAGPRAAVLAVVCAMALLGLVAYLGAPPDDRHAAVFGHSWLVCPLFVAVLSLPGLAGALWALRGLAPTRPAAAGFACGLMAGALGAAGYALACDEHSPTFVALWYSAGALLPALLGALLGPRLLRW
jgi:hypothetical protein